MPVNLKDLPVEAQIKRIFGKDAKLATAIFKAESGLRCNAVGDGHLTFKKGDITYGASYGVAQIRHLPGRPHPEELKNCTFNLLYAYQMHQKQGWKPWSAYLNQSYKRYY